MKGKKVLSVLLASVMMFTAVPAGSIGAMAAPVQNAQVQGAYGCEKGRNRICGPELQSDR